MYNLNRIELIGNLGGDPELRYTPTGTPYTKLSVATNARWQDRSGELKEATEWHTVLFWGDQAELAAKSLKKGSFVHIEGSLKSRTYDDKAGVQHRVWEVRGSRLGFLDRRERCEGEISPPDELQADATPTAGDDIPF